MQRMILFFRPVYLVRPSVWLFIYFPFCMFYLCDCVLILIFFGYIFFFSVLWHGCERKRAWPFDAHAGRWIDGCVTVVDCCSNLNAARKRKLKNPTKTPKETNKSHSPFSSSSSLPQSFSL